MPRRLDAHPKAKPPPKYPFDNWVRELEIQSGSIVGFFSGTDAQVRKGEADFASKNDNFRALFVNWLGDHPEVDLAIKESHTIYKDDIKGGQAIGISIEFESRSASEARAREREQRGAPAELAAAA